MNRIINIHPSVILILLSVLLPSIANGQEGSHETQKEHPKHLVSVSVGSAFTPIAGNIGNTEARGIFSPTVGLDYFFHFHPKWEVGIITNLELDHYVIVDNQLERENALILSLLGKYNFTNYWSVFAGGGIELEQHDNLAVLRAGLQYAILLKKDWVITPRFFLDFKEKFNTWSFTISFGKRF